MKEVWIIIISCFLTLSCSQENITPKEKNTNGCSIEATIRNYSGLDGCGYVLELKDGSILEPVLMVVCGPPPQNIITVDNPVLNFEEEGKKVFIDYEPMQSVGICMVGQTVKVICISEAAGASNE